MNRTRRRKAKARRRIARQQAWLDSWRRAVRRKADALWWCEEQVKYQRILAERS